ncbi:MAG: hypothetical protein R2867_07450 [Caldilineaceae bacterium]
MPRWPQPSRISYILEYDVDDASWRNDILSHPLPIENGMLTLSD